jgi:uncharacterized membrane protein YhiD involved in acid resistance
MRHRLFALGIVVVLASWPLHGQPAETPAPPAQDPLAYPETSTESLLNELRAVVVRLPLAAALGTALALRPRRRGTPPRQPAVVQTQIVLAIVGALIMLVVGASLARAFGIVGAANLIRYRSKIEDPKDAVVMLSTLAVGLAAGVGLFALALFSTLFLVAALWVIEGFEPQTRVFELSVKLGDQTGELRPKIEGVLRRFKTEYELRQSGSDEVSYVVTAPLGMHTDRVSNALTALAGGKGEVKWNEKPKAKK